MNIVPASSAKGRRVFSVTLLAALLALGGQAAQARSSFEAPDPDYHGEIKASPVTGTAILAGSEVALDGRGFTPGQQITLSRGGVAWHATQGLRRAFALASGASFWRAMWRNS